MHACPCCGYKTLPERAAYDLCPVCWWEDEGLRPWEYSEPNGQTLVEAQQEFLAQRLPYRLRPGKVRAPRRGEERDPDWRPFELTDELLDRAERLTADWQRAFEQEERRIQEEVARDPEGPLKDYNAAVRVLRAEATRLPHREVRSRLRDLSRAHGLRFPPAELELLARLLQDQGYYRDHPLRTAWWLLRYARPKTFTRRWAEVRTGDVRFIG